MHYRHGHVSWEGGGGHLHPGHTKRQLLGLHKDHHVGYGWILVGLGLCSFHWTSTAMPNSPFWSLGTSGPKTCSNSMACPPAMSRLPARCGQFVTSASRWHRFCGCSTKSLCWSHSAPIPFNLRRSSTQFPLPYPGSQHREETCKCHSNSHSWAPLDAKTAIPRPLCRITGPLHAPRGKFLTRALLQGTVVCSELHSSCHSDSANRGGVFAQHAHSANYYVVYPGKTPANHPPTEACMINLKQHGVQNSGPWDLSQPSDSKKKSLVYQQGPQGAEFSTLGHVATGGGKQPAFRTAHGAPPDAILWVEQFFFEI